MRAPKLSFSKIFPKNSIPPMPFPIHSPNQSQSLAQPNPSIASHLWPISNFPFPPFSSDRLHLLLSMAPSSSIHFYVAQYWPRRIFPSPNFPFNLPNSFTFSFFTFSNSFRVSQKSPKKWMSQTSIAFANPPMFWSIPSMFFFCFQFPF